ncbi:hypothetical protein BY996DRAFT_4586206 [Phakopsora pachyrhizi]|uniref:Expressed protein n=1 Tax=Phakopsora pachyrhizi TaxID=170000 RepID=A0AAV0AP80_PHAPC|nr:hypothetical protein BY996DRAFT_4586206 [Phakopsora pachyrhizi]CAH7670864.1 expressed protein [Phakopsora pachyrhizi]
MLFFFFSLLDRPLPEQPSLPNFDRITLRQKELDKSFGRVKPKTRRWRKQLEADKLALVKKVFAQSGKISDLPGAYCGNYDIQKLRPGQWMNDEVATFYGVMINMRSNKLEELKLKKTKNGQKFLKAHCFNSFFINKYDDSGYEGVKRWSKKIDLFKKDVIIFPINIRNSHWTCAAINIKKKRFEFYDSMGNHNDSILAILRDYIVNESKTKRNQELDVSDWSNFYHPAVPQQQNGFDCGIFVCQFMDCLSRDWGDGNDTIFDFDQSNMGYIRTKMVYEIATKEFLDEEWK